MYACRLSAEMSTILRTVSTPSKNSAGCTVATKGTKASEDWTANPMATRVLDKANTYMEARADISPLVVPIALWRTRCSVFMADIMAVQRSGEPVGATGIDGLS